MTDSFRKADRETWPFDFTAFRSGQVRGRFGPSICLFGASFGRRTGDEEKWVLRENE
jgi:hypothetical protein